MHRRQRIPRETRRTDQATPPSGYAHRTARWRCAYRAYNIVQAVHDRGARETPQAGSGNAAIRLSPQDCPMALRLSGLQISCRPFTTGRAPGNPTGRIRQRRHPAIRAGLPDGAALIGPTNVVQAVHDRESPGEPHRPDQATPPSGYLRRTARWRDAYRAYNIVQAVNDREPRKTPQAG
jgi:hypothetical protein